LSQSQGRPAPYGVFYSNASTVPPFMMVGLVLLLFRKPTSFICHSNPGVHSCFPPSSRTVGFLATFFSTHSPVIPQNPFCTPRNPLFFPKRKGLLPFPLFPPQWTFDLGEVLHKTPYLSSAPLYPFAKICELETPNPTFFFCLLVPIALGVD